MTTEEKPEIYCLGRDMAPDEEYDDDFCDLYESSEIGSPCEGRCYYAKLPISQVGDFEPWMVEFLEGNLYALPPSIRTKDARERWREVANARIAAAISRLFEEVER